MAGALSFEDALRVLEARGRFMQEACEERDGTMVSVIGLSADKVRDIAKQEGVEVANLNSEAQTVLSGDRAGIEAAAKIAEETGAKRAIILNVAGAFHSSLMRSAATKLEQVLAKVKIASPEIPVIANVTGQPHGGPEQIRRDMIRQVTESVQWFSCIQWFMNNGVQEYVECGPGRVLTGLIKRIDAEATLHNVQDVSTLNKVLGRQ